MKWMNEKFTEEEFDRLWDLKTRKTNWHDFIMKMAAEYERHLPKKQ